MPAIEITQLVKRFPARKSVGKQRAAEVLAVAGLDLRIQQGECLAILGPNGAGKTTTVEMIEGLTPPTEGQIKIFGEAWGQSSAQDQRLRSVIGVQLQESNFQDKLTVGETIALFASFYPHSQSRDALLALVALESKKDALVHQLSGGQRQRMALACALAGQPKILCLDEPTTGLDPQSRRQIWEIVESFKASGGTVLLTTHYMEEAARLADRVAIMDGGRLIALDTTEGLIASLGAEEIAEIRTDAQPDIDRLSQLPGVQRAQAIVRDGQRGARLILQDIALALPAILAELESTGQRLEGLVIHRASLEDVFIHHTGRGLRDA